MPGAEAARYIDRAGLERGMNRVRLLSRDAQAGVFGPDTKIWQVNKETAIFLGAGRAALLQLAHPFVAYAIDRHSKTRDDPLGRFRRTFYQVFSMVFGTQECAFRASQAVWATHSRVSGTLPAGAGAWRAGTRYHANHPQALLWVHATLWDTSVACYEALVRHLCLEEKHDYYEETKRFAYLFGIPEEVLPPDWNAFRAYVEGMLASDLLVVTPVAAEMARCLFRPPLPGLGPLMRRYAEVTSWLLPERLAVGFGLDRGGKAGRARYQQTLRQLAALYRRLPRRLRYLPAYVEARRRLAGREGRDWIGELMTRALVGAPRLG